MRSYEVSLFCGSNSGHFIHKVKFVFKKFINFKHALWKPSEKVLN